MKQAELTVALRFRHALKISAGLLLLIGIALPAVADTPLTLTPSLSSPQPVGTPIVWTASATGAPTGQLYQFSVIPAGGSATIIQAYDTASTFPWTTLQEGSWQISVDVPGFGSASAPFTFTPRAAIGAPVVSPTAHPLVALYSAPPCAGGQVRIRFQPQGGNIWQSTPPQNCNGASSLNSYVGGLRANTTYVLQQEFLGTDGSLAYGPQLPFQTGSPGMSLPAGSVIRAADSSTSSEPVVLTSLVGVFGSLTGAVATDLDGNVIWYQPENAGSYLMRPVRGGTFFSIKSGMVNGTADVGQYLIETDLAGNVVRQASVTAINQQLVLRGVDQIGWLHHDALRLQNGHTVVIAAVERLYSNVQGATGQVDVLGDMIIDLDQNLQVTWTWNAFDFLDINRASTLNETCASNQGACGILFLGAIANDWTHSNSLFFTPDGNLLMSVRSQDWVIKIDYRNGAGTGGVIWHLGPNGGFTISSNDPTEWFSHQHDIEFDGTNYALLDNGNTRYVNAGNSGNSRGQVYSLNVPGRVATLVLNVDLGGYSQGFGSAQTLANGNYQFLNGWINGNSLSQSLEYQPNGTQNFVFQLADTAYRSFRMPDLYTYGSGTDTFFVRRLYSDLLSRTPDDGGVDYWLTAVKNGTRTHAAAAADFFGSPEFTANAAFVYDAYQVVLGRDPDFSGWLYWDSQAESGGPGAGGIISALLGSEEYAQRFGTNPDSATFVTNLYQTALQRAPDTPGLSFWTAQLDGGAMTRTQVVQAFAGSSEYRSRVGNRSSTFLMYFGFLRRDPDIAGVSYWEEQLNGGLPLVNAIGAFISSEEYLARFAGI